jgi:hypothetical protein
MEPGFFLQNTRTAREITVICYDSGLIRESKTSHIQTISAF